MEVVALIISILAFILSVVQFFRDSLRQKKEATLIAYNELQDNVFVKLNMVMIYQKLNTEAVNGKK